jgi:hypothetical protein
MTPNLAEIGGHGAATDDEIILIRPHERWEITLMLASEMPRANVLETLFQLHVGAGSAVIREWIAELSSADKEQAALLACAFGTPRGSRRSYHDKLRAVLPEMERSGETT